MPKKQTLEAIFIGSHLDSKGFTGNKTKMEGVFQFLYGDEIITCAGSDYVSWEWRYNRFVAGSITEEYLHETARNREGFRLVGSNWVLADSQ